MEKSERESRRAFVKKSIVAVAQGILSIPAFARDEPHAVTTYERPAKLEGLSFSSVHVKNRHEFGFVGHKIIVDDAWEPTETFLVFCDLRKEGDDRWTVIPVGYTDRTAGSSAALPQSTWFFGRKSDAELFLVDDQCQLTREQIPTPPGYIGACMRTLYGVPGGHAYAVSGERRIWKREAAGRWVPMVTGIPVINYLLKKNDRLSSAHGFDCISGFSDTDLYACGGEGDLWHYDGTRWEQVRLPTKDDLEHICCGGDGMVYIATNSESIVYGRGDRWKVIKQELTPQVFEDITWYQDRLYISTEWSLYEFKDGKFAKAAIAEGSPHTFGKVDARDGVMLCMTPSGEMSYHNEEGWHKLIYKERPPRDPNEPTLLELMQEMIRKQKEDREREK